MRISRHNRVKERTLLENILKILHDYAYAETLIIVSFYLIIGYLINPDDVCMLHGQISYILILLTIITLFHGFENGMLALGILAFAIWFFYPSFEYVEFLVALMMTMIFSEFHYYWTQKIKAAEINANYRGEKLDELSRAFYSLKISHDQLEKNYVIKPMSIRNSIEYIINSNREIDNDATIEDKYGEYFKRFLGLLEKSFSVNSVLMLYRDQEDSAKFLNAQNANVVYSSKANKYDLETIFEDYLVDKAIGRSSAIYISDTQGEPSVNVDKGSHFIAALPSVRHNQVDELLVIEMMPFMSFNRENLTSISILLEYFSIQINQKIQLQEVHDLDIIPDEVFKFEYLRLKHLYTKYKVNSVFLVLRLDNELQATRIYERIKKMLRSLDMVTMIENNELYYITLLFPLHDNAAALGYLNRLRGALREERDREFEFMTFDFSKIKLLNKYYREDYDR